MDSKVVAVFSSNTGDKSNESPCRPVIRALLLAIAVWLMGCERESTTTQVTAEGNPNAVARLEITSDPTSQAWIANVSDDFTAVTINGTTPFLQDFPAPDGLAATVRKLNAGGTLTACLTNLSTADRRCATTSAPQGIVSLSVIN
jgi:hypothetical protein